MEMNKRSIELHRRKLNNGEYETTLAIERTIMREMASMLSGSEIKLFLALYCMADDNGECRLSQEELGDITGLTVNTVNKAVNSLMEKSIEGIKLLNREIRGSGSAKISIYHMPINVIYTDEQLKVREDKPVNHLVYVQPQTISSTEVLKLFKEKYLETYGVEYSPNFKRDLSLIKNKLLPQYTEDEIRTIIKITFEQYEQRWRKPEYPTPTIGAICTWLGTQALVIGKEKAKKETSWDNFDNDDDYLATF